MNEKELYKKWLERFPEKKGTASRKYKVGAPTPFCRAYRLKRWKREKDDNKDYYYCILCPVPHRICGKRGTTGLMKEALDERKSYLHQLSKKIYNELRNAIREQIN